MEYYEIAISDFNGIIPLNTAVNTRELHSLQAWARQQATQSVSHGQSVPRAQELGTPEIKEADW